MIIELASGIVAASGTFYKRPDGSRFIVTTRKAASTNPNKVRMYFRRASSYRRTTPPSEKELQARSLFQRRQAYVRQLLSDHICRTRAEAWKRAKNDITT